MRQFLQSMTSYTNFTLAFPKFNRTKAFVEVKNEICCMDLPFGDKLAKEIKSLKLIPVRQDLFGRTVDAKGMKKKNFNGTVKMI